MKPPSASSTGRGPVVLLALQARDDALNMYADYLRFHGLVPLEVSNARDAQEQAREADIIVTDIFLDGPADGIELVSRLRDSHQTRHTPIVVLTACASAGDRARAARAGCDVFLVKPCLPDVLLLEVLELLRSATCQRYECTDAPRAHAEIANHQHEVFEADTSQTGKSALSCDHTMIGYRSPMNYSVGIGCRDGSGLRIVIALSALVH